MSIKIVLQLKLTNKRYSNDQFDNHASRVSIYNGLDEKFSTAIFNFARNTCIRHNFIFCSMIAHIAKKITFFFSKNRYCIFP